jgi:hypothetical protein
MNYDKYNIIDLRDRLNELHALRGICDNALRDRDYF